MFANSSGFRTDYLGTESRAQILGEQMCVVLQGNRRIAVTQLAGNLNDRSAISDHEGCSRMPDLVRTAGFYSSIDQEFFESSRFASVTQMLACGLAPD